MCDSHAVECEEGRSHDRLSFLRRVRESLRNLDRGQKPALVAAAHRAVWEYYSRVLRAEDDHRGSAALTYDEGTFRRLRERLERELHRGLTADEVTALRLAEPLAEPAESIEAGQKTDSLIEVDPSDPAE